MAATVRHQLAVQRQFDTLSADLRCLAEALDGQPPLPPRGRPVEAVPFATSALPDCRWPNIPESKAGCGAAGLSTDDVLELEDRTFRLLASMNDAPKHVGPLTDAMLDAAKPPPYQARAKIFVASRSASAPSAAAAAPHTSQQFLNTLPPIDDADLQPDYNGRLPESYFPSQRLAQHSTQQNLTAAELLKQREEEEAALAAAPRKAAAAAAAAEGSENAGWPDESPLPPDAHQGLSEAASALFEALGGGKRIDHAALGRLLAGRTIGELYLLRQAHQSARGTDPAELILSHSDAACRLAGSLLQSKAALDASIAHAALKPALDALAKGKPVDSAKMVDWIALLEVVCTSRPTALVAMQHAYTDQSHGSAFYTDLTRVLAHEDRGGGAPRAVSADAAAVLKLLRALLQSAEGAEAASNPDIVASDGEALRAAFVGNAPKIDALLEVLPRRTQEHRLEAVRHADARTGTPLAELVRSRMQGNLQRAMLLLIEDPSTTYYPHLLHAACHGLKATPALKGVVATLGASSSIAETVASAVSTPLHGDTLARVLGARYGRDLSAISSAYQRHYRTSLRDDVNSTLGVTHTSLKPLALGLLDGTLGGASASSIGNEAARRAVLESEYDALPNANELGYVESAHEHRWRHAPVKPQRASIDQNQPQPAAIPPPATKVTAQDSWASTWGTATSNRQEPQEPWPPAQFAKPAHAPEAQWSQPVQSGQAPAAQWPPAQLSQPAAATPMQASAHGLPTLRCDDVFGLNTSKSKQVHQPVQNPVPVSAIPNPYHQPVQNQQVANPYHQPVQNPAPQVMQSRLPPPPQYPGAPGVLLPPPPQLPTGPAGVQWSQSAQLGQPPPPQWPPAQFPQPTQPGVFSQPVAPQPAATTTPSGQPRLKCADVFGLNTEPSQSQEPKSEYSMSELEGIFGGSGANNGLPSVEDYGAMGSTHTVQDHITNSAVRAKAAARPKSIAVCGRHSGGDSWAPETEAEAARLMHDGSRRTGTF